MVNIKKHVDSRKPKNTMLQCIGYILVLIGVAYLLFFLLLGHHLCLHIWPQDIAIIFFIMMLGMAFIFPELLQDRTKGLSTMRIVVFMMVNVICLLLLKLGWDQPTLKAIGVDQWWMGIIAFVFGAKATQAYFESNLAKLPVVAPPDNSGPGIPPDQLIQMAINQNKTAFTKGNITAVMHGKMYKNGQLQDCITVHLNDTLMAGYPSLVSVRTNQGNIVDVAVDYITDVEMPKALSGSYSDGALIWNNDSPLAKGTVCCKLHSPTKNKNYVLTCSHVMNAGGDANNAGFLNSPMPASPNGSWVWGMRTDDLDAALIEIDVDTIFTYNDLSLKGTQPRALTADDMFSIDVVMVGQNNAGKPRIVTGKITNFNSVQPINISYNEGAKPLVNLVVLSQVVSNGISTSYATLSNPGDSGALIYDQDFKPIAMVVAGNQQFTYAIPLPTILLNTQTIIA